MKLFVYHNSGFKPIDIHAIKNFTNETTCLCSEELTYIDTYDKKDYLDTTRPFCEKCKRLLKADHNINMKQLAINQKLGVK